MANKKLDICSNLTFKTLSYRKNFDMFVNNENIITEHTGNISLLNINEMGSPLIIGEYGFSVWDIRLAKILNINVIKLIKSHKNDNIYDEVISNKKEFKFKDYNKMIFIHTLVLHPDYRKKEITDEFFEFIYRDFYSENNIIIGLFMPIQNNYINADVYFNHKNVPIKNEITDKFENIPAVKYYELDKLKEINDIETIEYKLFILASRCGFNRINNSHLFIFNPEKIIERIKDKYRKFIDIFNNRFDFL